VAVTQFNSQGLSMGAIHTSSIESESASSRRSSQEVHTRHTAETVLNCGPGENLRKSRLEYKYNNATCLMYSIDDSKSENQLITSSYHHQIFSVLEHSFSVTCVIKTRSTIIILIYSINPSCSSSRTRVELYKTS
jgi:hypothetical protein